MEHSSTPTLYERLGGPLAIDELVDRLDERLILDPALAHHFADADLARLATHQRELITLLLGGTGDYSGPRLRDAHSGLGLSHEDFDRFLVHVAAALCAMAAPPQAVDDVCDAFEALRAEVVSRPA